MNKTAFANLMTVLSLLAAGASAGANTVRCPATMANVGQTPDGAWTVCELALREELSGGLVPAGELLFVHANGSTRSFRKTSKAMYGCNGQ